MTIRIEMPIPDDWHVHLRDGILMERVVDLSGHQFLNNLVMPNLTPPVTTAEAVADYYGRLVGHSRALNSIGTRMALYLTPDTTASDIEAAHPLAIAAKYYPHGGTTNSGSGLSSPRDLQPEVLAAMQDVGMVLCLHAELTPDVESDPQKREFGFIPHLQWLVDAYPELKIVVEHVSDRRMLDYVLTSPETVAASITAHHPFITQMDAIQDPHCNCMPIAKTPDDRDYLARIILEAAGRPKIFFGSDSAPHLIERKLGGAAGVWSSPVAIPVLWQHFDAQGGAEKWENFLAFMCANGASFYGVGPSLERRPRITLWRQPWRVPEEYFGMKPWKAGEILDWQVESVLWFSDLGNNAD
ncbi:MAG: hypothetical protein U0526_01055 [Candidatus Saccharibacteria bacterium]